MNHCQNIFKGMRTPSCHVSVDDRSLPLAEAVKYQRLHHQARMRPSEREMGRMADSYSPPKEMLSYYERNDEAHRLSHAEGLLEFVRAKDIIMRYLNPPPITVLDVGGGSGPYSCWLARTGYKVHLIDPVPLLVKQAEEASARQPEFPIASCSVGDARKLNHSDASADAVLCMGPLYHLTNRNDRLIALKEAYRVLKGGGLFIGAAISRYASVLDGLRQSFNDDPAFLKIVEQDLKEGQHRNTTDNIAYFTDAFLHLPEELQQEVAEAGFEQVKLISVEGPAWLFNNLDSYMNDHERQETLLRLLRLLEEAPSILGASAHMLCVARKP